MLGEYSENPQVSYSEKTCVNIPDPSEMVTSIQTQFSEEVGLGSSENLDVHQSTPNSTSGGQLDFLRDTLDDNLIF